MKTGAAISGVLALLWAACAQQSAAPLDAARPDPSAQLGGGAGEGHGTTERGTVTPGPGEGPAGPELSREERERILRGTERPAPTGEGSDR